MDLSQYTEVITKPKGEGRKASKRKKRFLVVRQYPLPFVLTGLVLTCLLTAALLTYVGMKVDHKYSLERLERQHYLERLRATH